MTKIETIKIIEDYLIKRKFELKISGTGQDYISFEYTSNYSNIVINLFIERDLKDKLTVKYYSNNDIQNIKRLRNSTSSKNYLRSIFDNLNYIKVESNRISREKKEKIDNRKKYSTELESHYKRIHNQVNVVVYLYNKETDDSEHISIIITCYDNNKRTIYNIISRDNKYYLTNKEEKYSSNQPI